MKKGLWKIAVAGAGPAAAVCTGADGADYSQFRARVQARLAQQLPRLSLTEGQKLEVDRLIKASIERRIAILQKHGVEPGGNNQQAAMKSAMPEIEGVNSELRGKLAAILSQDQLKTFDEITDAMRKAIFAELSGSR